MSDFNVPLDNSQDYINRIEADIETLRERFASHSPGTPAHREAGFEHKGLTLGRAYLIEMRNGYQAKLIEQQNVIDAIKHNHSLMKSQMQDKIDDLEMVNTEYTNATNRIDEYLHTHELKGWGKNVVTILLESHEAQQSRIDALEKMIYTHVGLTDIMRDATAAERALYDEIQRTHGKLDEQATEPTVVEAENTRLNNLLIEQNYLSYHDGLFVIRNHRHLIVGVGDTISRAIDDMQNEQATEPLTALDNDILDDMRAGTAERLEDIAVDAITEGLSDDERKLLLRALLDPATSFIWSTFNSLNDKGLLFWSEHRQEVWLSHLGKRVLARLRGGE